jgi:phage shock protein PspC (stress-responsive transcriptional regulator)
MNTVITINIASTAFFIDEDAYTHLHNYQKKLEKWFESKEGGQEIISDIETRLSELFAERVTSKNGVITNKMVTEVITIMGQPEDFTAEDPENETTTPPKEESATGTKGTKKLHRDIDHKVLGGVCSGIAAYFNTDPVWVRIAFAVLPFLSFGVIIPIYIVLWIAIPAAITTTQKMQMRGESINISNIEKNFKEEYEKVKTGFSNANKNMTKRDRNVLLVVAIVAVVLVFTHLPGTPVPGVHHVDFSFPFSFHFAGGLIPLIIILLGLGLIFKSAFKGFLILILILLLLTIILKLIFGTLALAPWIMI